MIYNFEYKTYLDELILKFKALRQGFLNACHLCKMLLIFSEKLNFLLFKHIAEKQCANDYIKLGSLFINFTL